jgi:hypothetical protein
MTTKTFDQNLYNKYDSKARQAAKKFINKKHPNLRVVDNPNKYGIDLLLYDSENKLVGEVEVETKVSWVGRILPDFYKGIVNVPSRKYSILNKDKVHYFLFNSDYTRVLVAIGKEITKCPKEEVINKYVPNGELFYKVPTSLVLKYRDV